MTNKERLISLLGFAPSQEAITGAFVDADLDDWETYTLDDSVAIKTMAIGIMELLLTTADTTNDMGFVIKYDRAAVLKRITLLKGEIGITDESYPTITSKRVW